jgi:ribose transport system substrate-binding protein
MQHLSRRRFLTGVATIAAFSLAAVACGGDDSESGAGSDGDAKTIAIISPYYAAQPATKEVVDAFTTDAEAKGWTVTLKDTNNDLPGVNNEMSNAVAQKVDAIVLGMGDPLEFSAGLLAAKNAGIPVFGLDAGAADGVTANITSDNAFLGEASAKAMVDAIGGSGKVAMIHFDPFEPVRLRGEAAKAYFEANGIEIVEYQQGDPADSTGFAKTKSLEWLTKYGEGEIDGIWAGWDASALGAYQATVEAGRPEVVITGVDGQDFARAEVKKGLNWVVTVRQDWPGIAAKAVEVIEANFAGTAPAGQVVTVPGQVLDKTNA